MDEYEIARWLDEEAERLATEVGDDFGVVVVGSPDAQGRAGMWAKDSETYAQVPAGMVEVALHLTESVFKDPEIPEELKIKARKRLEDVLHGAERRV